MEQWNDGILGTFVIHFENSRKVLGFCTTLLGCDIYQCKGCGYVELIHD